jgi:hypothetical protein
VTAASLFDGHDAAIDVMRRLLQAQGAEVVHLGHDRSVDTVVRAVVEEDVQGVAISSGTVVFWLQLWVAVDAVRGPTRVITAFRRRSSMPLREPQRTELNAIITAWQCGLL